MSATTDATITGLMTVSPVSEQPKSNPIVKPESKTIKSKFDMSKIFIDGMSVIEALNAAEVKHQLVCKEEKNSRYSYTSLAETNDVAVHLGDAYCKIDHVPGLKTTLYPHQQTAVKAMFDLEQTRVLTLRTKEYGVASNLTYNVIYNAAVLSEPVGSGKTLDILALIILKKIPRAIPDIMALPHYHTHVASTGYIRREFTKILKPTIIFVGVSVMKQWENAIKIFTNLKFYTVNNINDLRPLLTKIVDRSINDYDIVLVKNGKITVPIEMPAGIPLEDKNKTSNAFIYNILANFREYCWARVVIDDFDTIRLPHNAGIVNGLFTWFVSSTRKKMDFRSSTTCKATTASEMLKQFDYGCAKIMYNHFMFYYLNVRNHIDYLKATTQLPNPKYHIAVFKNPNNVYISLLGSMEDSQINRITEMLNGDALGDAAEAAGIKSTKVSDIFERILGQQFQNYRFAGDLLAFIEHCKETEDDRLPMSENPDPEDKYYTKRDLKEFREIEYKYPGVNGLLDSTEVEYTEVKKSSGLAIERVKDNIKEGQCAVCRIDLSEAKDTALAKCCGTVFCGTCGIEGQNLKDRYNKLNGRCGKCRAPITIKDLIYMENFDLSKIENEEFEDDDEPVKPGAKSAVVSNKPRTKYTAVVDVIYGRPVVESKRADMHIGNMMKGGAFPPEPTVRKVLIFANYDETLKNVVKELDEEKIHYWRLMGSASDIDIVSRAFTACTTTCAMIINSTKHCSGLNLQTATDLIFTHLIQDNGIETQVVGRGHRLGRKSRLNVWYFLYDNELQTMTSTHGVRDLTAEELAEEAKFEAGHAVSAINTVVDNTNDCYLGKDSGRSSAKDSTNKNPTEPVFKSMDADMPIGHHRNEHNMEEEAVDVDDEDLADEDLDDEDLDE